MWSSDSDLEMLTLLSDWSDLSSDDDTIRKSDHSDDSTATSINAASDDVSMYCDENESQSSSYSGQSKAGEEIIHSWRCNVCGSSITKFRYTCVQCNDFDLCGACECGGAHDQHYVLRVPALRTEAEVQLVLATIRAHLMKRMDPISDPNHDRDDVSVKSEIKQEIEDIDDCDNHGDVEDNGDGDDSSDCDNDNDENIEPNNDEDLGSKTKSQDLISNRSKPSLIHTQEDFESVVNITIKEEPQFEHEADQASVSTDAVALPIIPSTAKHKLIVTDETDINHSSAKKKSIMPASRKLRGMEVRLNRVTSQSSED